MCGYVLDHGDVPECGGHRPHVNVLIRLEDLQKRARAACLDFGRQVHSTEWIVRIRDGVPEFVPPKWIDRTRTPRRKALPQLVGVAC